MEKGNYGKMAVMLGVSFAIMYAVMFLNVDSADHIYLSLTRTFSCFCFSAMACCTLLSTSSAVSCGLRVR